jgi:hypothetical protein
MSDMSGMTDEVPQIPGAMGNILGVAEATSASQNPLLLFGYGAYRAQNTILKGGFLDNKRGTGLAARSRAKFRPFVGNALDPLGPQGASQFVGGTRLRPTRQSLSQGRIFTSTRRGDRLARGRKSCS